MNLSAKRCFVVVQYGAGFFAGSRRISYVDANAAVLWVASLATGARLHHYL